MKKTNHWHPEVEPLETMTLLSGMTGVERSVIAAQKAVPVLPHPLVLVGSIHGTVKAKGFGGATINGSGAFGSVGKMAFKGHLALSTATGDNGTLTATSKKLGKLFVTLDLTPSGTSLAGTYTIAAGTRSFAGETGSGLVSATLTASRFTATFSAAPTPTPTPTPTSTPPIQKPILA